MSRIYSSTNRIKFTDIPEKYAIPRQYRSKQNEVHTAVVIYVYSNYKDTKKFRQKVVDVLNSLTYCIIDGVLPSMNWKTSDPINTAPELDMEEVEKTLGDFYLVPDAIEWDMIPASEIPEDDLRNPNLAVSISSPVQEIKSNPEPIVATQVPSSILVTPVVNRPLRDAKKGQPREAKKTSSKVTQKEDLYIQPPKCPRFDINKVWMAIQVGGDNLVIYTTLPEIPTKQNEISITTNVDSMTDSELMALYPNQLIHTRNPAMYIKYSGLDYDEDLGSIFPISGFSKEQIIDNIIRYPHLFRLRKVGPNNELSTFFHSIEINGELFPIQDIWDNLPDAKLIPRDSEFIKEYVIRRYLLEEQAGIPHKYKMAGNLGPFLTLFMPPNKYIEKGYTDTIGIVKQCVISRVCYKQSRSPILRRIEEAKRV